MYLAKQEDNIHPHFTGNDKGLYATMIGGSIDPWLYGDIRCTKMYNTNTASRQF